ncbi:MAG: dihydrodipicolinate reductase C-terminal domain-containing protein, partial [Ornithinimicrobium sp.]
MVHSIGVFGRGRLGSLIAETVEASPHLTCAWVLGRGGAPSERVDVAIDVSHRDAVGAHVAWADESETDLVIGATGWPAEVLRDSGRHSGVLIAPNFSLSMALMHRIARVLGGYSHLLPGQVDLAVTETHHRGKVDAPSGSAALLTDAVAQGAGLRASDIPTSSLRMGSVIGRHEVRLEADGESMTLSHEAHSRNVFAAGAIAAACWVNGRRGVYTVDDWAADQLDSLFATPPGNSGALATHPNDTSTSNPAPHALPTLQ